MGRNAAPRLMGRDDAFTFAFYNELNCLNKQVKPLFVGREITEAKM